MGQYDRVSFDANTQPGNKVTRRQRQAFLHVDSLILPRFNKQLHCYQGSWEPETDYSGTTHTRAGAADLYVYGMSTMSQEDLSQITRLLRREGRQAAFLRGPFVKMPWHWHVLDLDTTRMDEHIGYGGVWQVGEYRKGNDGLVAGRKDPFPYRPNPIRKWEYKN